MKTLSPAVITLPWRQDAAEFYFSRLSHLPWAMLLHSGYALSLIHICQRIVRGNHLVIQIVFSLVGVKKNAGLTGV